MFNTASLELDRFDEPFVPDIIDESDRCDDWEILISEVSFDIMMANLGKSQQVAEV